MTTPTGRKVILLEFNEITWNIIDPMVRKGRLPHLARLRAEGAWAAPVAPEKPPLLDPWVTWVTLHTGVPQAVHGATVLGQDDATIRAKRTWHYAIEAGLSVGIFGSISAFPPDPVPGFIVPGPFAPTDGTFPPYLQPIQAVNRRYTQVHAKQAAPQSPLDMAKDGLKLFSLGLTPKTAARVARQLVSERRAPHLHWKRVSLQPFINLDFFEALYRRYRPDFSTWHTNHAAHYMHHYWRAHDDSAFLVRASAEERAKYGAAVEYGYEVCDELLGRFLELRDPGTVLVLASSMGQQPYVKDDFPEGRIVVRFTDVRRLLDIVGARGVTEVAPTMVPQVNVTIPEASERARVRDLLLAVRREGALEAVPPGALNVEETGDILTLTPVGLSRAARIRYYFPGAPGAGAEGYALEELFAMDTPTPKQGYHHPTGLLVLHGDGIRAGVDLGETSTLDIAPTLLALLGVPIPTSMKGRVLSQAWEEPAPRVPLAAAS